MLDLLLSPVNGLMILVSLAMVGVALWALIDAAIRPVAAYPAAGKQTKWLWLALTAAAVFFAGDLGLLGIAAMVVAIVYLVDVRPAVREVPRGGRSGPYGPW